MVAANESRLTASMISWMAGSWALTPGTPAQASNRITEKDDRAFSDGLAFLLFGLWEDEFDRCPATSASTDLRTGTHTDPHIEP